MLVAGIDSSTQSTKVLLCDAADGTVVGEASAQHPDGTECDPRHWWDALTSAGRELLERADAVAVGAQQHGMVVLDKAGSVIRPAMLWNDVKSAPQAARLVEEFGGAAEWARRTGSVPTMSFTVTKLRWLAESEPEKAARVHRVLLPHDWLTWRLAGGGPSGDADLTPTTDRGDASGTGYFDPASGAWLPDFASRALGHPVELPRVAAPHEIVGRTDWGAVIAPGTGDNMGAALGLDLGEGDMAVSIGTSGTAYAVTPRPSADVTGSVAGFADATGRFLPLVATVNAARVLVVTARMLGTDPAGFAQLALKASPGADGLTFLPYLDGERTPNRPDANGVLRGLTSSNTTPENLARAAVEAVLCSLADAIDHVTAVTGTAPRRIVLIGGAARSVAIRAIAPAVFGVPVTVPEPAEYVALGAARQAAWALASASATGAAALPKWPEPRSKTFEATPEPQVREQYGALRDDAAAWQLLARGTTPRSPPAARPIASDRKRRAAPYVESGRDDHLQAGAALGRGEGLGRGIQRNLRRHQRVEGHDTARGQVDGARVDLVHPAHHRDRQPLAACERGAERRGIRARDAAEHHAPARPHRLHRDPHPVVVSRELECDVCPI
jgi:xylulokinase